MFGKKLEHYSGTTLRKAVEKLVICYHESGIGKNSGQIKLKVNMTTGHPWIPTAEEAKLYLLGFQLGFFNKKPNMQRKTKSILTGIVHTTLEKSTPK